jgi:hypothetical protein
LIPSRKTTAEADAAERAAPSKAGPVGIRVAMIIVCAVMRRLPVPGLIAVSAGFATRVQERVCKTSWRRTLVARVSKVK